MQIGAKGEDATASCSDFVAHWLTHTSFSEDNLQALLAKKEMHVKPLILLV
jgi:hypothetical protein